MIRQNRNKSALHLHIDRQPFLDAPHESPHERKRLEEQLLARLGVNFDLYQQYRAKGIITILVDHSKAADQLKIGKGRARLDRDKALKLDKQVKIEKLVRTEKVDRQQKQKEKGDRIEKREVGARNQRTFQSEWAQKYSGGQWLNKNDRQRQKPQKVAFFSKKDQDEQKKMNHKGWRMGFQSRAPIDNQRQFIQVQKLREQKGRIEHDMDDINRAKRILIEQNEVLKRRLEFMSRHQHDFKDQAIRLD